MGPLGVAFATSQYCAQAIQALVLHVLSLSLPTLSTSYPAGCEVKVKWSEVKWKVKWSVFGSLFFLKLIYIIDHVYTFIARQGKCAQQLSYGFNILNKLEKFTQKN